MKKDSLDLQKLRKKIDDIDYQIHDLLNKRAKQALKIAEIKVKEDGELVNFYRPERETQILNQISEYNTGPLTSKAISKIFNSIMNECRNLQINQYPELKK